MFRRPKTTDIPNLGPDESNARFPRADVLFALEWSAIAPGMGGWDVLIDDERRTRLLSIVPPGSDSPAFFIVTNGRSVTLRWLAPRDGSEVIEVGQFMTLRDALLALCPLTEDQLHTVNEAMEILYPRKQRNPR